jgi:hypothetical protein
MRPLPIARWGRQPRRSIAALRAAPRQGGGNQADGHRPFRAVVSNITRDREKAPRGPSPPL